MVQYEQIQVLPGHQGMVWALFASTTGSFVVSVSQDKSIRIWSRTEEQLFPEEEREKALEQSIFEQESKHDTVLLTSWLSVY